MKKQKKRTALLISQLRLLILINHFIVFNLDLLRHNTQMILADTISIPWCLHVCVV